MRTWTLHPELLYSATDCKTYVANWSETLQGLGAIQGKHKMHVNHPQLNRFKQQYDCEVALYTYLFYLFIDSRERLTPKGFNFQFDISKINLTKVDYNLSMPVSLKQVQFERWHLNNKRTEKGLPIIKDIKLHPLFYIDNNYIDCIEKGSKLQ